MCIFLNGNDFILNKAQSPFSSNMAERFPKTRNCRITANSSKDSLRENIRCHWMLTEEMLSLGVYSLQIAGGISLRSYALFVECRLELCVMASMSVFLPCLNCCLMHKLGQFFVESGLFIQWIIFSWVILRMKLKYHRDS